MANNETFFHLRQYHSFQSLTILYTTWYIEDNLWPVIRYAPSSWISEADPDLDVGNSILH